MCGLNGDVTVTAPELGQGEVIVLGAESAVRKHNDRERSRSLGVMNPELQILAAADIGEDELLNGLDLERRRPRLPSGEARWILPLLRHSVPGQDQHNESRSSDYVSSHGASGPG